MTYPAHARTEIDFVNARPSLPTPPRLMQRWALDGITARPLRRSESTADIRVISTNLAFPIYTLTKHNSALSMLDFLTKSP